MIAEVSMGPSIVDEKGYWRGVIEELQVKFSATCKEKESGLLSRPESSIRPAAEDLNTIPSLVGISLSRGATFQTLTD
jgi:hypothetical protein